MSTQTGKTDWTNIIIFGVIALILIIGIVFFFRMRKRKKLIEEIKKKFPGMTDASFKGKSIKELEKLLA